MHTITKKIEGAWLVEAYGYTVQNNLSKEEAMRLCNYLNGGAGTRYINETLPSVPCPIEDAANWQRAVHKASKMDDAVRKAKSVELLMEEIQEWQDACHPHGHGDDIAAERHEVKELYDIIFTAVGRLLALGYDPHLVMEDGNASNWTKLQSDEPLKNSYNEKQEAKKVGDKWGVFEDGKLQKGPWYEKPTFEGCKKTA